MVLTDCLLLMGIYDVGGHHNSLTLTLKADVADVSLFGDTSKRKAVGALDWSLEGNGLLDFNAVSGETVPDKYFETLLAGGNQPITICAHGYANGRRAYGGRLILAEYKPGATYGEALNFSISAEGHGSLPDGKMLDSYTFTSAETHTSTPVELGAVGADDTLVGIMHVPEFDATSLIIKLQSSATEGGVYSDRITFGTATAEDAERATLAGPVTDTWWRYEATLAGGNETAKYYGFAAIE